MKHERHYIDGDQLSQEILQRILSQIGVKDNVAITIVHNGTIGRRSVAFCTMCKTTGVVLLEAPLIKNGTDFYLIALIGGVIAKKYDSDIFIHTNDKALAKAAIDYGAMNLYMVAQVLINKDQKYLRNDKPNLSVN